MEKYFPGYYLPTDEEINKQWEAGIFVFDTNVLLNIYSYPEDAREEFIGALESFKDMTWIPYQVMLEFHRNRYKRISSSNKPVIDLRDLIKKSLQNIEQGFKAIQFEKRNTGIFDIDDRISNFKLAGADVLEAIETACKRLSGANLNDAVANRLAKIYSTRVGSAPKDQEELDNLVEGAEHRFEQKIPPGFADARDKNATFYHRGLKYQAQYGDLIVWRQMINHVREVAGTHVIFVTAEMKIDFWLKDDRENIIGPLPALIEEFLMETGATSFWLYSPEQFLEQAKIRNNQLVSTNTINEVREVTHLKEIEQADLFVTSTADGWLNNSSKEKITRYFLFKYFALRYPQSKVDVLDNVYSLKHGEFKNFYRATILESDNLEVFSNFCAGLVEPMLYEKFIVVLFLPFRIWGEYSILKRAWLESHVREIMKKNLIFQVTVVAYEERTIMDFHDIEWDI